MHGQTLSGQFRADDNHERRHTNRGTPTPRSGTGLNARGGAALDQPDTARHARSLSQQRRLDEMVENACRWLRRLLRVQCPAGEGQRRRNRDGNLLARHRTVNEQTSGVIAARNVFGIGRRIGLIRSWRRLRMTVTLAMRVIRWGCAIVRHRRTRGVIMLRTPTQQGVQQNAEDRQWCRDEPHEYPNQWGGDLLAEVDPLYCNIITNRRARQHQSGTIKPVCLMSN